MQEEYACDRSWAIDLGVVGLSDIVRFAGAAGDFNPNHHDEAMAQSAGFHRVFAMGLFTASLSSNLIVEKFQAEDVRSLSCRFIAPVLAGEHLTGTAKTVREAHLERVDFDVVNASGELKLSGQATVGVRRDDADSGPPHRAAAAGVRALDQTLKHRIGATLRCFTMPIERGKLLEFGRASRIRKWPRSYSEVLVEGFPLIPLTFSNVQMIYTEADPADLLRDLGMNPMRTVHGEHFWRYERPFVEGEMAFGETRLEDAVIKRGGRGRMRFVTTLTEFRTSAGDLLQSERMVSIEHLD